MMATHRTIWRFVKTELRVIPNHEDACAQDRITLYVSEGVFSFCFPLSPEDARTLANDLVAGADTLKSPEPALTAQEEHP